MGNQYLTTSTVVDENNGRYQYILRWVIFDIGLPLVAYIIKNLPAMQETRVRSLGWEDPLEKEMAAYSSTAWRIP